MFSFRLPAGSSSLLPDSLTQEFRPVGIVEACDVGRAISDERQEGGLGGACQAVLLAPAPSDSMRHMKRSSNRTRSFSFRSRSATARSFSAGRRPPSTCASSGFTTAEGWVVFLAVPKNKRHTPVLARSTRILKKSENYVGNYGICCPQLPDVARRCTLPRPGIGNRVSSS